MVNRLKRQLGAVGVLSLAICSVGCDAEEEQSPADACEEVADFIEDCEGEQCEDEEMARQYQICASGADGKADMTGWAVSYLSSQARECWNQQDANCMKGVYRNLARGAYLAGYWAAAGNMHHFLDNTGARRTMSGSDFSRDPGVKESMAEVRAELDRIAAGMAPSTSRQVNIGGRGSWPSANEMYLAVGAFTLTATATIQKDHTGRARYTINYRATDRYDWHPSQGGFAASAATIAGSGFQDAWAQLMVNKHVARPYDITASWNETTPWR